ncbi:glycoprotein endo-alpha-1,2-mannosidase-like protein [Platysternon megacephalum]|uniref:Glycoprotein endo-alpha-1,2-mannosidase-like protein n=1 Tax=Platysternon megacephalum TaxID=55544 RepID=A0A4D9EQ07_9SAUR|nr:glycoprotein endo-alpha-1,2-mannosidase-like protein [Platysternon megacephalum]
MDNWRRSQIIASEAEQGSFFGGNTMERRSGRLASLQKQKPNIYRETGVRRVFKRPYRSKHSSSATRLKRNCSPEQDRCPHSDGDAEDSTEQPTCSTELHEGSSCSSKCLPETSTLVDTTNNPPVLHNQGQIPLAFVHGFRLPSETCKQQMQLKLRHQNEILQQHLQREIDDFQGQIAELQIQVATLAKTHRQQRASVVKYSESYKTGAQICMFGLCWEYSRSPDVILQRDNTPGNCWALRGSRGYVVVKLSRVIHPLAVTLDHIAKEDSQTEEISSAPKNFAIYGLKEGFGEKGGAFLGEFVYDQEGFPVQTFKLEVFLVEYKPLRKMVALKTMKKSELLDGDLIKRVDKCWREFTPLDYNPGSDLVWCWQPDVEEAGANILTIRGAGSLSQGFRCVQEELCLSPGISRASESVTVCLVRNTAPSYLALAADTAL